MHPSFTSPNLFPAVGYPITATGTCVSGWCDPICTDDRNQKVGRTGERTSAKPDLQPDQA